jgi:hypothetical protein
MNGFASALRQYRDALVAWGATARPESLRMFQLHMETLEDIEACYVRTNDPNQCRLLVESAKLIHTPASFGGRSGNRLREALADLVQEVTPDDT